MSAFRSRGGTGSVSPTNLMSRAGLSDEALRQAVQKVVPVNTGALFLSVIGLMMVVVGILFS